MITFEIFGIFEKKNSFEKHLARAFIWANKKARKLNGRWLNNFFKIAWQSMEVCSSQQRWKLHRTWLLLLLLLLLLIINVGFQNCNNGTMRRIRRMTTYADCCYSLNNNISNSDGNTVFFGRTISFMIPCIRSNEQTSCYTITDEQISCYTITSYSTPGPVQFWFHDSKWHLDC